MYQIGDFIFYGKTGVCLVQNITSSEDSNAPQGLKAGCKYYILQPIYQSETIYTPADNSKVFMRSVISREEAEELIRLIPSIQAESYDSAKAQELKDYYELSTSKRDCGDLIEIILSIYAKRHFAEQQNRKLGQVDEQYMKRAEELLYGEFSIALGIPRKEVPVYIAKRVDNLKMGAAALIGYGTRKS